MDRPLKRPLRRLALPAAVGLLVLLAGPLADWLRVKGLTAGDAARADAVYLVCGARSQQRRLGALIARLDTRADGKRPPLVLVGNDTENSLWSRAAQRNLTRAEWAVKHIESAVEGGGSEGAPEIVIVPGSFRGTDGEMEALAAFLKTRPGIAAIDMVTCPFHARRVLIRLRHYAGNELKVGFAPVVPRLSERNPALTLLELLKMARDALGLARTPGLSRKTP